MSKVKSQMRSKIFQRYRLWQVSIVPKGECRREYHVFSSLSKALSWIKLYTYTCIEETGQPNIKSMNVMVFNMETLPTSIDETPLLEWCKQKGLKQ